MATISSIGTSSRNYSTNAAWLAAFAAGGWEGEQYNDSEFITTAALGFSGHSTSAVNYIKLSAAAGQGFRGNGSAASNALKYNVTNGAGLRQTNNYNATITISESWVTLFGLQIKNDGSNGSRIVEVAGSLSGISIDSCIMDFAGSNPATGAVTLSSGTMTNSLVINRATTGDGIFFSYPAGTPVAMNCTVVRPSNVSASGNGFRGNSGNWTAINCAVFGFSAFHSGGTPTSCSNNASDVTIGTGSSNQASKTYTSQFQGTTSGAMDFRAKAAADLLENATSTGAPSTDIIGTSRPQGAAYDIGCWELAAAAAAAPFVNLFANPISAAAASIAFWAITAQPLGTPQGYPSGKPFAQNNWPNPIIEPSPYLAVTSQPHGRLTAYYPSFVQPPLNQLDWPNPVRAALNIAAQTSQRAGMPFGYLSSDAPFAQRNWPNPILAPYGFQRATSQSLGRITALLPVFIQPPLNQYDWPNPVLRVRAVNTQPLGSPLIDCTLNGKGIKPFAQTQWPNPRGAYFFAIPLIVYQPAIFRSDGQPGNPWTPVTPVSETWTAATPSTDIWTPQVPGAPTWTEQ